MIGGRSFSFDSPVCKKLRSDGISGGYLLAFFNFFRLMCRFVLIGFFEVILCVFPINFDVNVTMIGMCVDVCFIVFIDFFSG